ncbi:MAG: hypothetical protein H7258_08500 [Ferruginibacter sp.]|nr:hypothetical protein [Ferruginibacter sp.]
MKIEQLIVQYLYTNKTVTLQDIGIFHLSPTVTISPEQDKDAALPDNAITFEYNIKAVQDDKLIDFIVQQTRKIKPLATSDLESFTILGRQFMNIGKPLPIEGLGILQKNQLGEYEFIQGHSINPRLEPLPALLREKDKGDIIFTTAPRKQQSKNGIVAAVIVFLLLAASAAFYFIFKDNKEPKAEQLVVQKTPDTSVISRKDTPRVNIAPTVKDAALNIAPVKTDSYSFKIVIRDYTTQETSDAVFKKFTVYGHKLVQYSKDSIVFKLAMPFNAALSDTTRARDSLQRIFGGKPYVEIN